MVLVLITLGVLPSLLWLALYLREDEHPEPSKLLLRTFIFGALSAPLAAGAEYILIEILDMLALPTFLSNVILFIVVIGITEEYVKYLAVRLSDEPTASFDEPADAMMYMIVAALGFAAVENVLAAFSPYVLTHSDLAEVLGLRFLSATLLHVLASAILGYFIAQRHFFHRQGQIVKGVIVAGVLHGLYNIFTLESGDFVNLGMTLLIVALLAMMAITVNILFYKLKKQYLT